MTIGEVRQDVALVGMNYTCPVYITGEEWDNHEGIYSITCSLRDVISALDRSLSVSFSLAILSLSLRSASKSSCKIGNFLQIGSN